MNLTFRNVIAIMTVVLNMIPMAAEANAQTVLPPEDIRQMVDSVTSQWDDWETLSISGKFKMAGLPLSPSVKIYMEKDSSIFISLRAPLMGEVGRAEICDSTLRIVNKMHKVYMEEHLAKAMAYYPGGVGDLQNLLLGRAVIAGYGQLSPGLADIVEVYEEEDGLRTLIAAEEARLDGFNYGYSFSGEGLLLALMVLPVEKPDVAVTLAYTYFEKGYDLEFTYISEKKNYRATLELNTPEPSGGEISPIKLGDRYTKLSFEDFMKSF